MSATSSTAPLVVASPPPPEVTEPAATTTTDNSSSSQQDILGDTVEEEDVIEYQATNEVSFSGRRVHTLPAEESDQIATLPRGCVIRLVQVADGWGKLHTSMESLVKNTAGYKPHDLHTEGWTMLYDENGRTYFSHKTTVTVRPGVTTTVIGPSVSTASPAMTSDSAIRPPLRGFSIYAALPPQGPGDVHVVRRQPSLFAKPVSSVPINDKIRISYVRNGWGKIHRSSEEQLRSSLQYQTHNLETEGFILISSGDTIYFEEQFVSYKVANELPNVPNISTRMRKWPAYNAVEIGPVSMRIELKLTRLVNGWGKLHRSMDAIIRQEPAFELFSIPFNIEEEGWVEVHVCGNDVYVPADPSLYERERELETERDSKPSWRETSNNGRRERYSLRLMCPQEIVLDNLPQCLSDVLSHLKKGTKQKKFTIL